MVPLWHRGLLLAIYLSIPSAAPLVGADISSIAHENDAAGPQTLPHLGDGNAAETGVAADALSLAEEQEFDRTRMVAAEAHVQGIAAPGAQTRFETPLTGAVVDLGNGGEYIPLTYRIKEMQSECIYDLFRKDDQVTHSSFLVESAIHGPLAINLRFEGPVLHPSPQESTGTSELGRALRTGLEEWPKIIDADVGVRYDDRIILQNLRLDWSHAGEDEDAAHMRQRINNEKMDAIANYHATVEQPGGKRDEGNNKLRTITMSHVNPFEVTNVIKAPGWYRVCVTADMHALLVTMELRNGNVLGGIDPTTGHVYTYAERDRLNEEKLMDEEVARNDEIQRKLEFGTTSTLTAELLKTIQNQVKETHLHSTKEQLSHLTSMIAEIRRTQDHHHDQIRNHKAAAQRNFDSTVFSGKLEMAIYIVIAVVQAYTVRQWLLGPALLGDKVDISLDTWSKFN